MKFLFVYLIALTAVSVCAQSNAAPTITKNVSIALARIGWQDKIRLGKTSAKGDGITAQFSTAEDKKFVLAELKRSKDFKESNGLTLKYFHPGAERSFRQLSYPSLHIIWYKDRIELHFDMHCPGITHPIKSYRHFREVVVNWLHHSSTSQRRVAVGLENNLK